MVNPQGDTPDSGLTSGDAGLAAAATPTATVAPIGGMDGAVVPQATTAQTTVTLYIGGVLEYTGSSVVSSYLFGGTIVASRSSVGNPTSGNPGTLTYIHTDHLGSVSATSTAAGTIGPAQDFDPWGAPRSGNITSTSYNYTGQIKDAGTGLLYYNARYYDPAIARFVSADSIVPGTAAGSGGTAATLGYDERVALRPLTVDFHETPFVSTLNAENAFTQANGFHFQLDRQAQQQETYQWGPLNPQALNRYAYVLNNPLRYTDPTGHVRVDCGLLGCTIIFTTAETDAIRIALETGAGLFTLLAILFAESGVAAPVALITALVAALMAVGTGLLDAIVSLGGHLEIFISYLIPIPIPYAVFDTSEGENLLTHLRLPSATSDDSIGVQIAALSDQLTRLNRS